MVSLRSLRAISLREWLRILAAACLLAVVDISLRMRGYARTRRLMQVWTAAGSRETGGTQETEDLGCPTMRARNLEYAEAVGVRVARASRVVPWPVTCLRQALVAEALLTRRGVACQLHMGVRRDGPEHFGAHAWVSHAGCVILGGPDAGIRHQAWSDPVRRSTDATRDG